MEPTRERYGWLWFVAWVAVGAGLALGMVSFVPVLPVAAVVAVLLARKQTPAQAWWGALSGAGLLSLYVAYVQRHGPGSYCHSIGTARYPGTECGDYMDPRPWLALGILFALAGVVGFVVHRRRLAGTR
jgi:hypothetical protein